MNEDILKQPDPHHEKILHTGISYCYKGPTVIIGDLSITTSRIVFTTHRLNFSQFTIVIPISQIKDVQLKNHLRIFNHGIVITQHNGASDTFAVWRRKRWMNWIAKAREQFDRA